MKKITAYVLVVLMLFGSCFSVFASGSLNDLRALKIVPPEVSIDNLSEIITRESFSYMASKLLNSGERVPQKTVFSDVDEKSTYSGYIAFLNQLGIISGSGDGKFDPKGKLTIGAASKIIVTILGYKDAAEAKGGYHGGYETVSAELGLLKNVTVKDGFITVDGALEMVNNALGCPMASTEYYKDNDGFVANVSKDKDTTILNSVLGLNVYSAYVDSVNQKKGRIDVTITGNKQKTNKVILDSGMKKSFTVNGGINVAEFKYAPVTIMVDSEENVVAMALLKDVYVKFGVISSVNGDNNELSPSYNVDAIKRITVLDDETEYDTAEDFSVYYNEKQNFGAVSLISKPARLVIINGEIISVESWDLIEGGLITEVSEYEISYTVGDKAGFKLKNLDGFDKQYVYIDGKSAKIADVKKDALFYYYTNNTSLVLVVSQKKIVDKLYTASDSYFEIGGFLYNKGKNVYYKAGENGYQLNQMPLGLYNNLVKAYVAPNGKVSYVEAFGEVENTNEVFLGIVTGFEEDDFEEDILKIKVMRFKPDVEENIYTVYEKTALCDGITKEELKQSAGVIQSSNVFEFDMKADGKVASVKRALWLYGFEGPAEVNQSTFPSYSDAMLTINKKVFYINGTTLTVVGKEEGKVAAKNLPWSSLYGTGSGGKIALFVLSDNEFKSKADLIFVYGDATMPISARTSKYGVVSDMVQSVDDEGEKCVTVTIMSGTKNYTYDLTEEEAEGIKERSYVTLKDVTTLTDKKVSITGHYDMTGDYEDWAYVTGYATSGMHKGVVENIDEYRIITNEEGNTVATYFHPSYNFFVEIDKTSAKETVKNITYKDISVGDKVYYNLTGDGVRGVVLVKD